MARTAEPLERQHAQSRGTGRTPGGREVVKAQYTLMKREDAPPMPTGLRHRGKMEWAKVWASGPWLLPSQDYAWVEQISRAYDDIDVYRKRIDNDGLVTTGYAGQVVAHPLVAEIRKCEETIRKCLSILGFSPTDRARLGLAEVKRETALQQYISAARQNEGLRFFFHVRGRLRTLAEHDGVEHGLRLIVLFLHSGFSLFYECRMKNPLHCGVRYLACVRTSPSGVPVGSEET
jgi:P27 family predicted phage terminase small subunit